MIIYQQKKGQAIIEFIVLSSFVLIAFFWGFRYLYLMSDIQNKAHLSSRYAAWERINYSSDSLFNKSNEAVQNEISKRILSNSRRHLNTATDRLDIDSLARIELDPMLYMRSPNRGFQHQILWSEKSDTDFASFRTTKISKNTFNNYIDNVANGILKLDRNDAINSQVTFIARYHPQINLPRAGFAVRSKNAMAYETWSSSGTDHVRRVVRNSILGASSGLVLNTINSLSRPIKLLSGSQLEFGKVEPDIVPCERLSGSHGEKLCR